MVMTMEELKRDRDEFAPGVATRHDHGELDVCTVRPGDYLPLDCECGRQRLELLLRPVRLHCDKCRAVIVLDLSSCTWISDFVERG